MEAPDHLTKADVQELLGHVLGARIAQRYALAAIITALGKKGSLDAGDVYDLLRTCKSVFEGAAKWESSPLLAQAKVAASEELAALEPLITGMMSAQPGAGRA